MNLPPATFSTIGGISGLSEEETKQAWLNLWQEAIRLFLEWLIKEANLSPNQLNQLGDRLSQIQEEKKSDKMILELVAPVLDEQQQTLASDKFAKIFLDQIETTYRQFGAKMTLEQKQVYQAYLKQTENYA